MSAPACARCGEKPACVKSKLSPELCSRCGTVERAKKKLVTCRHCQQCRQHKCRGLCAGCYYTPGVRGRYEPVGPHGAAGARGAEGEPTEAELDAIIAEQMANLPDWWGDETERVRQGRDRRNDKGAA